jgi:hypothetical protein
MSVTPRNRPEATHRERMSVLTMFVCCGVLLAGFAYVLSYPPDTAIATRAPDPTSLIEVPAQLSTDETIGYR